MSTNMSKKKREDLISKIGQIRTFIASAPQDTNTGNLLSYLSELEKDINGKKYGLVFEQHKEHIDEVLEKNTPVLNEDKALFIDNGGTMNFLIEGDNLVALQLLEKTHKGKIDLIYIDPPYNTKNKDFIYDDKRIDSTDGFQHSKWLSFISERLKLARALLSPDGILTISIGYQEIHNLMLLCQELFSDRNIVSVTVQTSSGNAVQNGFTYVQEYIVFVTPTNFKPMEVEDEKKEYANPYHGMNLSGFNQTQRPNQTYPIFVDSTQRIVGCGKTLQELIDEGIYTGDKADFKYDYETAPEGTVPVWPITQHGDACVWRLIPSQLISNWEKGYIKVIPNKRGKNKYTVQYLSGGIIKQIESGELETYQPNSDVPTLEVIGFKTAASGIPTIWSDTKFLTSAGSKDIKNVFGCKVAFPFPKPVNLIVEILKRTCHKSMTILDFFAGSGTTGQAVLQFNIEHPDKKSNFILCTNNENNICKDVTYPRIKQVIANEKYDASLKVFRIRYIPITDRMYYEYADELLAHVRELVELENGINFTGNAEIAIILNEEDLEEFMENTVSLSQCRKLYMAHDILLDAEQEQKLRERNISVNIIPDYYYKELEG